MSLLRRQLSVRRNRGSLATVRPEDMMAEVIRGFTETSFSFETGDIDDLIIGCAFPEGEQGMNMSRLIGFRAGLPVFSAN